MVEIISNTSPLLYLYTHARRIARGAGLDVRGTLGVLIEAKSRGLTERIEPLVDRLESTGMWMSDVIRNRILALAGEAGEDRTGKPGRPRP